MMKTANTFIRNLIRSIILLLCATGVVLTPPHAAHADKPTINSVAITSTPNSNDYYGIGDRVQVTVTFSEAVVLGSMSFSLLVGDSSHTLTSPSGSGTATLVFHTGSLGAGSGDDHDGVSTSNAITGFVRAQNNLNDVSDLAYTPLSNVSGHKVDTTKPTVSSITFTSNAGDDKTYKKDDTIQATVTFSEKVKVTGTPQLTLKVGTADKTADYKSGSNSTQLVFEYTVASGDADTDGIEIEANKLALNSGTIKDVADNDATITHSAVTTKSSHKVDAVAPTVSSVEISSSAGDDTTYEKDDKIQVQVTFSEKVTVDTTGGTPQLTLKVGTKDKTATYKSGSNNKALVFEYTVGENDRDTDGVEIAANTLDLSGGTITDVPGNAATLTHDALGAHASHRVGMTAPTVSSIEISSSAGTDKTYKAADVILVTVKFSEKVTVTGEPQLNLTIGTLAEAAAYSIGTGTTKLVFAYTVVAGDTDIDGIEIGKDQLSFNSGTIKDNVGNDAVLDHDALSADASHKVDTTAPTVSLVEITSQPVIGTMYRLGGKIRATVTFSETVKVTGEPQLTLTIGSDDGNATYKSGSDSKNLVFEYTVAAGDADTDGIEIAADQLSLNGGTIKDIAGNAAVRDHDALAADDDHKVDGIVPTVSTIEITSDAGADDTYHKGDTIQATVTFSENMQVAISNDQSNTPKPPLLTLKIGSAERDAVYKSGGGTTALLFEYTVGGSDTDTDGIEIEADQLDKSLSAIGDAIGNDADLTHDALAADDEHKVDGVVPTLTNINDNGSITFNSAGADNTYKKGDKIQVTVAFTENVTVDTSGGTPQLTLRIQSGHKQADYASGSGTKNLVFEYTVGAADNDENGVLIERNKLDLNSGTIKDAVGNDADLTHGQISQGQSTRKVDSTAPTISSIAVTSTAAKASTYKIDEKIQITVTFSENMTVDTTDGTPQLTVRVGTKDKTTNYASGTGTAALVFEYTVASGDTDTDGIEILANKLALKGGTLTDIPGNPATITHTAVTTQDKVDGISPQIVANGIAITSTAGADKLYKIGDKIEATVTFTENVTVSGPPQLTLTIGSESRDADYDRGTGTKQFVFAYTVVTDDEDTDGVSVAASALKLNGGSITDPTNNDVVLTHAAVPTQANHKVDGVLATLADDGIAITSTTYPYVAGDVIQATVTFTETVLVTGIPRLQLKIGTANKNALYTSGSNSTALVFVYTVVAGDTDADGISVEANKLALNSGTIKDIASNDATLTHDTYIAPISHLVDTTAPTIVTTKGVTITSDAGADKTYKIGDKIQATVTFSEAVKRTGTPLLKLKTEAGDKKAYWTTGDETTNFIFEYTVVAGDMDTDGIQVWADQLDLNSGTITDLAGNTAVLTHAAVPTQTKHKIDAVIPSMATDGLAITSTPNLNDTYTAGEAIRAQMTFTENVYVTGTPQLTLEIGTAYLNATYKSGTDTKKLLFEYVVAANDSDIDGIEIEADALTLNNGTITDYAGNPTSLKHLGLTAQAKHKVDAKDPGIIANGIQITSTAGTYKTYRQGDKIRATVTFSELVKVTGTPRLELTIGASDKPANYKSGGGTTNLLFEYTVKSGDTDTDGISIAASSLALNGGTIKDKAGNAVLRTHAAVPTQADHKVDTINPAIVTNGIQITSSAGSTNTYKTGDRIQVTMTFSEIVTVTGTPQLTVRIGTANRTAAYRRGTGTTKLVFEYKVVTGDTDTDGIGIESNKVTLPDETVTIKDFGGNRATLTHTAITAQASHKVDTTSPTIPTNGIAITSDPGTGNIYTKNDTIQLQVTFSETVNVTGTPQLTLKIGAANRAADYTGGSGSTSLTFRYTVAEGDHDTDGIEIKANQLSLNGGTIADRVGNPATRTHTALARQASHKVDAVKPTVNPNGIAITSSAASTNNYKTDEIIRASVTFNKGVTVVGTPTLSLTIGSHYKTANYTGGSGSTTLVFEYRVTATDGDDDGISILANQLALPGNATIRDSLGNDATITHDALDTQPAHRVNATGGGAGGPRVSSIRISSTPTNGYYNAGHAIEVTVTFDADVTVTGTPRVTLNIGGTNKYANYTSTNANTRLLFSYTVLSTDLDSDGIEFAANALKLNRGTIRGTSLNSVANITHHASGLLSTHKVNGTISSPVQQAPGVSSVAITSTTYPYIADDIIQVQVTFSQAVNVTGKPQLTLNVGGAGKNANYTSGTGTTALVFTYTVVSGDTDADGIEIAANQLSLNSGTIRDSNNTAVGLSHSALTAQASHKVDTTVPTVATNGISITSTPGENSTYQANEKIRVQVTFSESVNITGTPQMTLKIGTKNKNATYTSGAGTTALVFAYTVKSGDADTDGISIDANQLSGTIKDIAGNNATLTHNLLSTQASHKVDGTTSSNPSISSVLLTSTGPYLAGDNIEVTISTSEAITVTGTPFLRVTVGSTDKTANYNRGSGSAALVFRYTVVTGDTDTNGVAVKANSLTLNSGTLKDADNNPLDSLNHGAVNGGTPHIVDTTPPSIGSDGVAITSSPSSGNTYKIGDKIEVTVTFSEKVKVTGTPQMTLKISSGDRKANFASGSGTTALVFAYTVASGDSDDNGISIEANTLALNNGTIKDAAGNPATLTHAALSTQQNAQAVGGVAAALGTPGLSNPGQANVAGSGSGTPHKVDGVTPNITTNGVAISSTPTNNYYKTGEVIQATVTFSEAVTVTGTPQLKLKIGGSSKPAPYESGSDSKALVFEYTVVAGDADSDGISVDAIQRNGGTIRDDAGNDADLTAVSLPTQANHKVDTSRPSINHVAITSTPGSDSAYQPGENIQVQVTFSEKVKVTGTPQLTLKIGTGYKGANYTSGDDSAKLIFAYTVVAGDSDDNGISIDGGQLSGVIKDAAGNEADKTNTTLGTQSAHKVGTPTSNPLQGGSSVQPTIQSVSLTSKGPYGLWDNITVSVTTSTAVTVTGSPTLTIIIGNREKKASYQSGSGSAALVFQYTVSASDGDDPNGISVKANSLTGGKIKDTGDNTLNPNHPALPDQGLTHQVDTTAPRVSSLAFTSTGPYNAGSTIQVTATTSESVTVTGSPSLTIVVGTAERKASYLSGSGTTALVFQYKVAPTDTDDTNGVSVKSNSLKLNSGTLLDAAGNALKLTHSGISNAGTAQAVGMTVSGISSVAFTSTGHYSLKDVIKITVKTAEKATVTGTPRIRMVIGQTTKYANYTSGTGTTSLVFQYTIVAGDSDTDGIEIPENALENYNGSTIKSRYQTALNLSHAGVEADTKHTVDTLQPVITEVAFATDAPTVYTAGSTIEVILTFAETGVKVTPDASGTMPSLSLLFGANSDPDSQKRVLAAPYKEARPGSTKLVFTYPVTADTPIDTDGVQIQKSSLKIPAGAAITDASENAIQATLNEDGSSFVGIKPASRLSSRPILPAFTSAGIVFNEFLNAKTDKHDWVELRNTTENEVSLGGWKLNISSGNAAQTDIVEFPDIKLPAGGVLLLMNTGHKENHLERSDAYTYRYFKVPELRLRGSNFSLMLRDRSGAIVDVISNYPANTGASGASAGFQRDEAYLREKPSTPGYEAAAWQPSGYQGGLGYDRKAPKATSLGTPGYLRSALVPQGASVVNISEVMFTTGTSGRLPQWIELFNPSKTEVVTLQGWRLQVELYDPSRQPTHQFVTLILHNALRILPKQTVLVVTKNGRNSQHFPEPRLYNLTQQNPEKVEQFGPKAEFLNSVGYAVVLRDEVGNLVDVAGNLDGDNNTHDVPGWRLPNCITAVGYRTSIIRQYEDGLPLEGTKKSSWFRATEMRRQIVTYYGHPKDLGNPGWKKGGPLPVQLSSFRAERTEQGALIQWTTESELENAGFNLLRSEKKTGPFQVVTPRMLQGAGTTSERSSYQYVDTTAKANVAYYYRLEEVSFAGVQQPVATRRLRGHVSAANRYLTTFGDIKKSE